jgi:hypothetical protein
MIEYGVFHKWRYPNSSMGTGKSENKMDDNWEYSHDLGNLPMMNVNAIWVWINTY